MVSAKDSKIPEKPNIKGDKINMLILTLMYLMQNIIFGLLQAFPLIMQNRKVSYTDQAEFNFAVYPLCFKLLWAPLVDCVYWKKIGRRKSWLIPMQYSMGIALFITSLNLDDWLGNDDRAEKPNIRLLTIMFFICTLLASIHDIALDGWSLTMLQKRNIGYAGLCNSVGSWTGFFISVVLFILLDSKDLCNMLRSEPKEYGFISPPNFLLFWSIVMLVSSTLMLIFKKDNSLEMIADSVKCKLGIKESYQHLWQVLKVKSIQILCIVLLTNKIGSAPANGVAPLKLIDSGITRDVLVLMNIPAFPVQIISSVVLSRYITGPRSMHTFLYVYVFKLVIVIALAVLVVFITPRLKNTDKTLPVWYYCLLLVPIYTMNNVTKYLIEIAVGSFLLRVSDPRYGGIYLTLLNTINNIGAQWPISLCLWTINLFSIKRYTGDTVEIVLDGYFTESIVFTLVAILWLFWGKKQIYKLEKTDASLWIAEQKVNAAKDEAFSMLPSKSPSGEPSQ